MATKKDRYAIYVDTDTRSRIESYVFPGEKLSFALARLLTEQIEWSGIDAPAEYPGQSKKLMMFTPFECDRKLLDAEAEKVSSNLLARDLIWSRLQDDPTDVIEDADEFHQWLLKQYGAKNPIPALGLLDAVQRRCSRKQAQQFMQQLLDDGRVEGKPFADSYHYWADPNYSRADNPVKATIALSPQSGEMYAFIVKEKSPCLSV